MRRLVLVVLAFVGLALLAPAALRSGAINRALDERALASKVALAETAPTGDAPAELPFESAAALERLTRPEGTLAVDVTELQDHRVDDDALTQELLTFPSAIALRYPESNTARAYLYRHGALGERPLVVWVPGLYVSEMAFPFIRCFFDAIFARGADVLFYVLPYHLERTPAGMHSGDAFLATDFVDHLRVFAQGLSDLRRLVAWLQSRGVSRIGAFGGSLGASLLMNVATWDADIDFLTVMIPLVSWEDEVLGTPALAPVRDKLVREGFDLDEVRAAYTSLDPTARAPKLDPKRTSLLQGAFDQVARSVPIARWAAAWKVTRRHAYPRGHTTILLTPAMYEDYGRLLDEDLATTGGTP